MSFQGTTKDTTSQAYQQIADTTGTQKMSNKRAQRNKFEGVRFGRLVVSHDTGKRAHGSVVWMCECDCGNSKEVRGGNLRSGNTMSCGCLHKEAAAKAKTKHGHARTKSHTPE